MARLWRFHAAFWPVLAWLVCLEGLAACQSGPQLPSALLEADEKPSKGPPRHALTLGVLPFEDGRLASEPPDAKGRFVYQNRVYLGTRLNALPGRPALWLQRRLAERLVANAVFARVVLADHPSDAPEVDLWLQGRLRRLRGYVEAKPDPKADPWVLAEAAFDAIRVWRPGQAPILDVEVGWSVLEQRPKDRAPKDPYWMLPEVLDPSFASLETLLSEAPLATLAVRQDPLDWKPPQASWDTLTPPPGHRLHRVANTHPMGWTGPSDCEAIQIVDPYGLRFNRRFGPHRAEVWLWRCPSGRARSLKRDADRFARPLPAAPGPDRPEADRPRQDRPRQDRPEADYFVYRQGRTNWDSAEAKLRAVLDLLAPAEKKPVKPKAQAPRTPLKSRFGA